VLVFQLMEYTAGISSVRQFSDETCVTI